MLARLYASAGLGHISAPRITVALFGLAAGLALSLVRLNGIWGFGVAGFVLSLIAALEVLRLLSQQREQALVSALPEVIEAIAAGISSGEELGQTLLVQATHGPRALKKSFATFAREQRAGQPLEAGLSWLQVELSNVYADQLIQLLLVSLRSGGSGLVANLQSLSEMIRKQGALDGELAAKQGWVTGTAKLGLAAPWFIVLFLNARPEAHAFYTSAAGFTLLSVGLFVCLIAYAAIIATGRLPKPKRVFINVV
jgi:tight adherence protein B